MYKTGLRIHRKTAILCNYIAESEKYISNGHWIFEKRYLPPWFLKTVEKNLGLEGRIGISEDQMKNAIAFSGVGDPFIAQDDPIRNMVVADATSEARLQKKYYWLIVEQLGFKIYLRGDGDTRHGLPLLNKDNKVVGAIMGMGR